MRFRVRTLMLAVALVAALTATATRVARCLRVRDEARRQVSYLRERIAEVDIALEQSEDSHSDPAEMALAAQMSDDERKTWLAEPDLLRRARESCKMLLLRWQRLADHP